MSTAQRHMVTPQASRPTTAPPPPTPASVGAHETSSCAPTPTKPYGFSPAAGRIQRQAPSAPLNPTRLTTVHLLRTYKRVNELFYARKKLSALWTSDIGVDNSTDYPLRKGELLVDRYEVLDTEPLGRGTYGIVAKCLDKKSNRPVAVKISRDNEFYLAQARVEKWLLEKFMLLGAEKHCIVELSDTFMLKGRQCLVFEILDKSLYDMLKLRAFRGLNLIQVQAVANRTMRSLAFLARPDVDVIHADIKPENLLLPTSQDLHGLTLIDFGSSCRSTENMQMYVQSRFYRAPEVLMGLPYGLEIDVWSLACTLCELLTGRPLFPGHHEKDQFQKIIEIIGLPPTAMVRDAAKRDARRKRRGHSDHLAQAPVKCVDFFDISSIDNKGYRLANGCNVKARKTTLSQILGTSPGDEKIPSKRPMALFVDFLTKLLEFDPQARLTAEEALRHSFLLESFDNKPKPSGEAQSMLSPHSKRDDQML